MSVVFSWSLVLAAPAQVLARQVLARTAPPVSHKPVPTRAVVPLVAPRPPHSLAENMQPIPQKQLARWLLAHPPKPAQEGVSLLDGAGQLKRNVPEGQAALWREEVHMGRMTPREAHLRRLWAAEVDLAAGEKPQAALAALQGLVRDTTSAEPVHGIALLDRALVHFEIGEFAQAAAQMRGLLNSKSLPAGIDRRGVSILLRHVLAAKGYHGIRARAGIPEPRSLDPFCGAAGLAVCLRALHMPYAKETVLAKMRVTGFGSTMRDIADAAERFGLNARVVRADETALVALPKPLVAYVEKDHFIAIIGADKSGVQYLCSDCGPFPGGGPIRLTWAQFRLLEASVYLTVSRPDSAADFLLKTALREPGRRTLLAGGLPAGQFAALASRHLSIFAAAATLSCSHQLNTTRCKPHVPCPMFCVSTACRIHGPAAGLAVNLATREVEYAPAADLVAFNPAGPSVSWSRIYDNLRLPTSDYESDDFGAGWSHPYNTYVLDGGTQPVARGAVGAAVQFSATGSDGPATGQTWDIVQNGQSVATSTVPNGWTFGSSYYYQVTPPAGASGTYEVRMLNNATPPAPVSMYLEVSPATSYPTVKQGDTQTLSYDALNLSPINAQAWDVVPKAGGAPVATASAPNGWSVTAGSSNNLIVRTPWNATVGDYEARYAYYQNSGHSVGLTVVTPHFVAMPGPKALVMPNGSRLTLNAPSVPTAQNLRVPCTVQSGALMTAEWDYDGSVTGHYTIVMPDRTRIVTNPASRWVGTGMVSQLGSVTDALGHSLVMQYGGWGQTGIPLLSAITNPGGQALLTFQRDPVLGSLQYVFDNRGREIKYTVGVYNVGFSTTYPALNNVSQVAAAGNAAPADRQVYGYQSLTNGVYGESVPYLHTLSVPAPQGGTTMTTATVNYDSYNVIVSSIVDANTNTQTFGAVPGMSSQTSVQTKDSSGTVLTTSQAGFDSNMSATSSANASGLTEVRTYGDPNDPYSPSYVADGNVLTSLVAGGSVTLGQNGTDAPAGSLAWDIVLRGQTVATSAAPGGWTVTFTNNQYYSSTLRVQAPAGTAVGMHYEVRYANGAAFASAFFDLTSVPRQGWSATYDVYGNIQTHTSARGVTTTYTWAYPVLPSGAGTQSITDANSWQFGELRKVQEGGKQATSFTYSKDNGLPLTITTPAPDNAGTVTTSYTYSNLGNILTVTKPGPNGNTTTTFSYTDGSYAPPEALGKPLTITDPNGNTTHLRYDMTNQTSLYMLRAVTDAIGNTTQISPYSPASGYNIAGQPIAVIYPATGSQGNGSTFEYYEYVYPGGPRYRTTLYDESNTIIRQTTESFGSEGETLATTEGNAGLGGTMTTWTAYDGAYREKTLTDPNGHVTTYAYNPAGYPASVAYPNVKTKVNNLSYDTMQYPIYDAIGAPLQRIDGRGIVTNYVYNDPASALTNTVYPAGSPTGNVSAFYDVYGRTTEIDDGAGARTFSYDDLNETLTATTTYLVVPGTGGNVNPATLPAKTITYTHNPDGSEASMQTPGGLFSYAYYNNGWLSQITNPSGLTTQSGYFANGWLYYEQTFKGGTLVTSATSTYNPRGFLTQLINRGIGTSQFGGSGAQGDLAKMTYDGAADLTNMQSYIPAAGAQAGGSSYAYDYKSQLTGETTNRGHVANNSFVYDAAGNSTTLRGVAMPAYNADNQYTGSQFVYDGTGNPTTYAGHAATYDEESRLTSVLGVTNGYMADGLRSSKQVGSNGRTYFLYAGHKPACELDASGNVLATNTWGGSGLIARTTPARTVCYAFDPQGNVSQAIDPNAAPGSQILNTCSADAYGYRYASTAYTDPYMGFGGKWGYYTDAETGLQLLGHRFYDSATGKFINRDPIGYEGGNNLYGYVFNNPIDAMDESGFSAHENDGQSGHGGVRNESCHPVRIAWDERVGNKRVIHWAYLPSGYCTNYNAFDVDFVEDYGDWYHIHPLLGDWTVGGYLCIGDMSRHNDIWGFPRDMGGSQKGYHWDPENPRYMISIGAFIKCNAIDWRMPIWGTSQAEGIYGEMGG